MAEKTLHTKLHTTTLSQHNHNFYTTSSHQFTSHQFFLTPFFFTPNFFTTFYFASSFFTTYYFLTLFLHATCFFTPSLLSPIHYPKIYTTSRLLGFKVFSTSKLQLLCLHKYLHFNILPQLISSITNPIHLYFFTTSTTSHLQ